jgi:hypothetical protein
MCHTVPQAVEAAAAGELGPAFTITAGAAYSMVAKEREERRSPQDLAREVALVILKRCRRDIAQLERLPQLGAGDVRALRDLTRVMRQAQLLLGEFGPAAGGDDPRAEHPDPSLSIAAQIAAREAENGHRALDYTEPM